MKIEEIKKVLSEFSLFRELDDYELTKIARYFHCYGNGKSKVMFFFKAIRLKMYILYMMEKSKFTKVI